MVEQPASPAQFADAVVIGAGVVGLATARALACAGRDTLVIERNRFPGQETTSRNSGVIHSGIYYPAGSLKARLCVRGRELLYRHCLDRDIPHRRCGKLVVAQENQLDDLKLLEAKARRNGVNDVELLTAAQVRELEPAIRCAAALWSPSTGIVDVHEFVQSLHADLERHGGAVAFGTELLGAAPVSSGFRLRVETAGEIDEIECALLVNCGGLSAVDNLSRLLGFPASARAKGYLAKGNYFALSGEKPFRRLVYPMPNEAGLGIHATLDLAGNVRFGPDVEWIETPDYDVDARRGAVFYDSIREYWPALKDGALSPDYAGIRPKIVGRGQAAADFVIQHAGEHGMVGLINLLGIESPGLTASLGIAEEVLAIANAAAGSGHPAV